MSEIAATRVAAVPGRRSARTLQGAWLLSGATVASGVLAYAYHVLAARTLSPHDYGLVAVLWAAMFLAVVVLFRPVEQTVSRALAVRIAREEEIRSVLRSGALLYGGISVVVLAVGALTWSLITDRLFLGDSLFTAALFAGLIAYGATYLLRGACGGLRWFRGYAGILLGDGVTRLVVAAPLVLVASRDLAAAAVAAAALGGAAVVLGRMRRALAPTAAFEQGEPFHQRAALAFALPATVIAAADQILVNGGTLLVMIGGGEGASKLAGLVFAATMLVRVPVFVFQGLASSLLPNLSRLHATDELAAFRRSTSRVLVLLTVCTAAIVIGAATIGPAAMEAVYGSEYAVGRTELTFLGIGVGFYLAMATFSQALLALDRGRVAAAAWSTSAGLFLLLYALLDGEPLLRVAIAFAGGTAAGAAALFFVLEKRVRSS